MFIKLYQRTLKRKRHCTVNSTLFVNILSTHYKMFRGLLTTVASIWHQNMPEYLSANMICSEKGKVFSEQASQTRLFLWTNIQVYFCAKWRLLCIYAISCWVLS